MADFAHLSKTMAGLTMGRHGGRAARAAARLPSSLEFAEKDKVEVAGKGTGRVKFIGPDHRTGELKVGVRLFKPDGKNNGTVAGHKYFKCEDHHGILTKPENVTLVKKFTASATA